MSSIRTRKTAGGATTTYLLQGASVVEERLSSGGVTKHFQGPGIDNVFATIDASGVASYYVRDHLGSIRQRTDASGNVLLTRDYDPWGNMLAGASTGGWSYTGREWDPEIGLYYYRVRYYDPNVGRFISEDPIGFLAGVNFYAYVGGNAVLLVDPSGLVNTLFWNGKVEKGLINAANNMLGVDLSKATAKAIREEMSFGELKELDNKDTTGERKLDILEGPVSTGPGEWDTSLLVGRGGVHGRAGGTISRGAAS